MPHRTHRVQKQHRGPQQRRLYRLGLVAAPSSREETRDPRLIRVPRAGGAGWHIDFMMLPRDPSTPDPRYPQAVLFARNVRAAQRVATLVYAAHAVLEGSLPLAPFQRPMPYRAFPMDPAELDEIDLDVRTALADDGSYLLAGGVVDACRFAAKLARHRKGQYACLKLLASYYCFSFHPLDLHPRYGRRDLSQSPSPADHVFWSQSIVSAFSAVEELGLSVRASREVPSVVDGGWNPSVLSDLRKRLQARRVGPDATMTWTVRGSRRAIEAKASEKLFSTSRAPWSVGTHVRDKTVALVDAINVASWLRSSVAAHGGQQLRPRLSPIDVHNVQMLARRLLLESFGELPSFAPRGAG